MAILLNLRFLVVLFMSATLGVAAYAYAASNTVPSKAVGSGNGTIVGYTVSGVTYGLNATTPSTIDTVSFTISPTAASTVKVRLVSSGGSWYTCTNTSGSVSCPSTGVMGISASTADQLSVVAAE